MKNDAIGFVGGSFKGLKLPKQTEIVAPKPGQLVMDSNFHMLQMTKDGWKTAVDLYFPFAFTEFTFLSIPTGMSNMPNVIENFSSSVSALATPYVNAEWFPRYFDLTGGFQTWTVPKDGVYDFYINGAGQLTSYFPIKGATVQFRKRLLAGDKLRMCLGKRASANGGNGASAVWLIRGTSTYMLACAAGSGSGVVNAASNTTEALVAPAHGRIDLASPGNGAGGTSQVVTSGGVTYAGQGGAGIGAYPTPPAHNGTRPTGVASTAIGGAPTGGSAGGFGGGGGAHGSAGGSFFALGGGGGYTGGNGRAELATYLNKVSQGGTSWCAAIGTGPGQVTSRSAYLESAANIGQCRVRFVSA